MKIAVTGAAGFLGWHVRCRAFGRGLECVGVRREDFADPARLADKLRDVDAVVHCAGVNRGTDAAVSDGNVAAAHLLVSATELLDRPIRIVYANSVQSATTTVYGMAKQRAGWILSQAGGGFSDVVLPNLFGEHGRPHYNSFVATFCHEIAAGRTPEIAQDREVPLLHVADAADLLIRQAYVTGDTVIEPPGRPVRVSAVRDLLAEYDMVYRSGELPDISGGFSVALFNTLRSYLFPGRYPINAPPRTDQRGTLVEGVRTGSAGGQAYVSTTTPGAVRGEHLHLRKFERFLVVDGEAEIALRRLFTKEVIRFRVSGEQPAIVDMPTMWAHNVTCVGDRPATTFFWCNELFNADDPDTFACAVDSAEAAE